MPQMRSWPFMARTMVEDSRCVKGLASRVWLDAAVSVPILRRRFYAWRAASLDRRARRGAVRTEHAAIARKGFQALAAPFAVIEESARVDGHGFHRPMSALWTGQHCFRNHA